ncbi:otogelin [Antennarius striatus]|uniref:otogelin n=1 Tax=Antennarius striatus TaxID=241820 RepID=UPI0035B11041
MPTSEQPARKALTNTSSDPSVKSGSESSQSASSQKPLSQSQSSLKTSVSPSSPSYSPHTSIAANQSINILKTSLHGSSQSQSDFSPVDQSQPPTRATQMSPPLAAKERPANNAPPPRQLKEGPSPALRRTAEPCPLPCLNGGHCVPSGSCDCSLYQATGHRCQTVPNRGFEREMTCRSWGQYNYETFDGLYFYFPGRCSYTLLRDCEETSRASVVVQVHNDPGCGSAPYTCPRSVSLFLPWEGEVRLHATNVTFKGQSLQLPHQLQDLQLERISHYVLVTQQHGFTLAWDGGGGSVYVKLSPEFVGRTCGLCGNFNADIQDDLKTSYGVLTHDVEMFGNSWAEAEPHEALCPAVLSGFPSPCAAVEAHVLQKVKEVCAALLDRPFQSCHALVSPLPYMASCSNDLCRSGVQGEAVCQVFSEYARACAHADHPLQDWRRDVPQCERRCPPGLQHRECISCCPASCSLERMCIDSRLTCLDGCHCPSGLVYEDGGCVRRSNCPCEHHGSFYPSGQTLQEECNNCTCVGGVWNCTDHSCPGECSVTGDMYFQSFDGRIYNFAATCQYVLAKSRSSGRFTVTIQNAPCGANLDGSCIQSVNLVIDEDPRTEITLSHVGEVFIAGQYRISLPYSDDVVHIQELSSMFLQVATPFGLRLLYSWAEFRLYLQADQLWKGDTVGLCGTFNGNTQDDFLSPSGMIESSPQLFGDAWRVSSACSPSLSAPPPDPCDTHQQAASYASEMCDLLNQELFSSCHQHLSPAPFHQQCRWDTCQCGTPCLCAALAHYAHHCRRFSIVIDFRSHVSDCAVVCPANMRYGTCVSSCQRRCSALSAPQHCGNECEEGCVCPPGSFYSGRMHSCVHRSECPCSFLGVDYEPGDVIVTSAGVQLCLNGKLVSQAVDTDQLCPAGQIYHRCSEGGLLPQRGVACEHTCSTHLLNISCPSHEPCVAGCACPPGLLKHGDECFEPDSCPCLWKGKEYYPGDRVSTPCHQCVCQHGTFQCVFHPCPSMCTVYGDRHYRTFDGLLFDYIGTCKVYLVKSTSEVVFSVTAQNLECFHGGVVCRKSLQISVGRTFVAFDDDTGKPSPSSVMDRKQRMLLWPAGHFTVVHFPEESITVLWDRKTTVHVQVGPQWQGMLSGLCGNFDTKTINEMRTPDNLDSPTPQEFGNSWTAVECVDSPDSRHPCSLHPLREPFAKRQCAVLLSEVFQTCHPVVDVTWFYSNCLADTCACSGGGDCECFCTSVGAYAQRCCHQGVPVDWRSPALCPYDCEFYNKALGKGPFRLTPFRDRLALLMASRSSGLVFLQRGDLSTAAALGAFSQFMMTPGLSRTRPHDTSRISFEVADRPNFFLCVSPSGQVRVAKWEKTEAFWDRATFVLHRNTWIPGYDSLESHAKPGFFLHATLPRLLLLKYRHTDGFRKATLFKLTGLSPDSLPSPRCQWRYDSCIIPCFRTCSDPSAEACVNIPHVEGCLPVCPPHMLLDEVTSRCVYAEDCISGPVAVQPQTPPTTLPPPAVTSSTTTSPLTSTAAIKSTMLSTPPYAYPTTKFTTSPPVSSTQITSAEAPLSPDELPHPDTISEAPSLPTRRPTLRPGVTEAVSGSRGTEAPSAAATPSAARTTKAVSATISPSAASATSFTVTAPFHPSSTKPPDSLQQHFTSTAMPELTTSSVEVLHPVTAPTEATTHSAADTVIMSSFTPSPAPVSPTPLTTDRTTAPRTVPPLFTETSTKLVTLEQRPSTTTTSSTTSSPLSTSSPVQSGTMSLSVVASAETTESVTPVAPFNTSKTKPYTTETTSHSVTTAETLHITPTEPRTSPPASTVPTSTPIRVTSTPTGPSAPTSAATDWRTTTREVTAFGPTVSITPEATTTRVLPLKMTDTTAASVSTSASYSERTSWSPAVPTMEKTWTTTSRSPEAPESSTIFRVPPGTTKRPDLTGDLTRTTTLPPVRTTESFLHSASTVQTAEPWRPPHLETSSALIHSPTTPPPEGVSESVVHIATPTESTHTPHLPATSKPVVTTAVTAAGIVTSPEMVTVEVLAPTTSKLITPPAPPMPHVTETPFSTVSPGVPPHVVTTTTTTPDITEMEQSVTGRVEASTRATTTLSPPWSPLYTTTSTPARRPSTATDAVHTSLVSTVTATPHATITRTSTLRTTARVPVTTRVTSRITSAQMTTIRSVTTRVTIGTRPPAIPTRITAPVPLTITPSPGTTTVSTSAGSITTAAPSLLSTTTVPELLRTIPESPVPTTSRESATSERSTPETHELPSISPPVTPPPETWHGTQKSDVLVPATTLAPSTTWVQETEQGKLQTTTPGVTTSPAPVEITRPPADGTSLAVSPTRMCTPPYAEIIDECTKYICINNQLILFNKSQSCPFSSELPNCGLLGFAILVNGDKCCPKWDCPCRCSIFPDLNVITFDGSSVAIYKAAFFIVSQLPNETVSVLVQECPADSPLLWNFTNLCLVALNITHNSNHVIINRLQRRLYVNSRYAKPRFKKFGFEIYDTGNMYLIRSPAGLRLQWYHSTGMMVVDMDVSSNKLPTVGLCGFCDGDPRNDLTLANGTTLDTDDDPATFITSWQVPNTTSYVSHARRRDLNCSISDCSTCLAMLENQAFSPCHIFVPPSTFCDIWVRDEEYVNNQCVALAAYVASCHKFNICIEWRSADFCPFMCPDALRYQACLPACTSQSCPNHDFDFDPDACSGLTEGCVCPEGMLLHRPYSALCISPEQCACTDSAGVPRAHGEVWKASEDACCMYSCHNDTVVPVEYDCANMEAPVCHRTGEMIISMADDNSCCPHKVCVCNQSLCVQLSPECESGEQLVAYYRQDSCCPDYVCECDPGLCQSDVPSCRDDQTRIASRVEGSCCLAHVCMCSPCPETPPHCLDGEVLTVDRNTTERCCPAYRCVCEPYRCPPHSCPVGMSVESSSVPGHCCPNQTCVCSCEKITSPKCGLGEEAQLDRAFLADPQNQCACKRFKCVREAVCVFGKRGVLRPGQTLVERGDDGLCHSRQCGHSLDPASGFHLLRTSSINCSAHCRPNQIYIPPKDQSTCCGMCRNISCLYQQENGTAVLYKPGRSWVSNCRRFDCTDTLSGPTLVSYSYSCPPFNESECLKIGGTVVSYMDGCCQTCTGFPLFPFPVSPLTPTVNTNCEQGKEDGKSCQKVTVRMTIRKNDCRSNRPVNIVSCDGKCPSASIYNYNINTYARFCKCCRETGLQRRSVQLYCSSNATWVNYGIQEPTDCSCQWS